MRMHTELCYHRIYYVPHYLKTADVFKKPLNWEIIVVEKKSQFAVIHVIAQEKGGWSKSRRIS